MKTLICIPTYNECENIIALIDEIQALGCGFDLLVIDDGSPDGTGAIVKEKMATTAGLFILERTSKQGLAAAYLAGFRWAIEKDYDFIGEMDADFSHPPKCLVTVKDLIASGRYDYLVGSRYVVGGGTVNWGLLRQIISKFGSLYARILLRVPLNDMTGGFNFWSRLALEKIDIENLIADGYVFQIELKARAHRAGMRGVEFPIVFEDRRVGQSKMSKKIVLEAMYKVPLLAVRL